VDLNYILQKFTLEAAGLMFISTKFGVFQGNAEAEKLMAAVSVLISQILHMFLIPPWLLKWTSNYRQFVESMETIAVIIGKKHSRINQTGRKRWFTGGNPACEADKPLWERLSDSNCDGN